MVWTVLLAVYAVVGLLLISGGVFMILRGKSGIDLIAAAFLWPILVLLTVLHRGK